jgi:hypothetical protein
MGALQDLHTGERIPLLARHRVGRAVACDLVVGGGHASREHALLAWEGGAWEVRDLGSHNGTAVDGRALAAGTRAVVRAGARLAFGGDTPTHTLVDDAPPEPMARAANGGWIEGAGGLLELPGHGEGGAVVLRGVEGGWVLEEEGRVLPVRDGEAVGGLRLALPAFDAATVPRVAAGDGQARGVFRVSLDEEQVELTVIEAGRAVDLGARTHHYLLLTLARQRLSDHELPSDEQGWIDADVLAHQLRLEPRYVNVLVHRARRQAAEAGLEMAHRLVERRDVARQLRLGLGALEVVR